MSDFRAIAAATLTLRNMLTDVLHKANDIVPGARVETQIPKRRDFPDIDRGVVNVYLYQVTPNPSWRNAELPTRRADGTLIQAPTLALDLHFLLSFYGDEEQLVPQILLGLTSTALHTMPYPPPRFIPRKNRDPGSIPDPLEEKLAGSGLLEQIELLRFAPLQMSHDELSRLWTIFFQIPYTLSVAYLCSVILIQPDLQPEPELPVIKPASIYFSLSHQLPQIEAVKPQVIDYDPNQPIIVEGRNLSPTGLEVKVGGLDAPVVRASSGAAVVQLPPKLDAGVQTITASRDTEIDGTRRKLFGESVASLVVRPSIDLPLLYHPEETDAAGNKIPANIEVGVQPAVRPGQSAQLLLNEMLPPTDRAPRAYSLPAEPPTAGELPAGGRLFFRANGVESGSYLTRLEVAGVASTLLIDDDPTSPDVGSFTGPVLHVVKPESNTTQ